MEPRVFDLDLQLLADSALMIVAVFVLFLIASYLLFNPVRDMMAKRQAKIKGELDDAAKDKEDAAALKAEYEEKLKNVDNENDNDQRDCGTCRGQYDDRIQCNSRKDKEGFTCNDPKSGKLNKGAGVCAENGTSCAESGEFPVDRGRHQLSQRL